MIFERGVTMEILEKTLYHDGIAFMRYSLSYPLGAEFAFAEEMTRGYAAYLEGGFLADLCAIYDADSARRKRYRHKLVVVKQSFRLYKAGEILSLLFQIKENEKEYAFAFTWDKERGILMKPCDFGVKKRGLGRKRLFFYDGTHLYLYDKNGALLRKVKGKTKTGG